MNNMLMQRIVDEVVFRLKQRSGKTLVLTVFNCETPAFKR